MKYYPTHHQAIMAMWLAARLDGAPSDVITRALEVSGCPRRLYVLAATLRHSN